MKKILILSFLAVLMLVTISFASAINTNADSEKKESPLFKIRIKSTIGQKIGGIYEQIKSKFLGERSFFLPIHWMIIKKQREHMFLVSYDTACLRCIKSSGQPGCCVTQSFA